MPATYLKKDLINLVRVEINRCLILNEDEKVQWTNEIDKLPAVGLRNVLALFRDNNSTVEGYISEALASK